MHDVSSWQRVGRLYAEQHAVVSRAGRLYPAAIDPLPAGTSLAQLVRLEPGTPPIDPALADGGEPWLKKVRSRAPGLHDGPVAAFDRFDGQGRLLCREGGYLGMLATCDALRAEVESAGIHGGLPLRERAHKAAAGSPLRSGNGRVAATGVAVAITVEATNQPARLLLGRRRGDLATDPGRWHVAPSGMIESGKGPILEQAIKRELQEELGLELEREAIRDRVECLGVGWDLLRLRPEVCLSLTLSDRELRAPDAVLGSTEFDDWRLIGKSPEELSRFWVEHPPEALTPAACATLALVESRH